MKVGVFDSGLGGLNVLNTISQKNKHDYYFLGDSLRAPYGDRSSEEIRKFSTQIVEFLSEFGIDHYVVACNTICATSLDFLREKYRYTFLSIVDMGVLETLKTKGDVLVLATRRTVETHVYKNRIQKNSNRNVKEIAAVKLVPIIENGMEDRKSLSDALDEYLNFANKNKTPNILLGCTHFPIIKDEIEKKLKYKANIIDPAEYLKDHMDFEQSKKNNLHLFMTSKTIQTQKTADQIFEKKVDIEQVSLK